jgi:hypothetical protein
MQIAKHIRVKIHPDNDPNTLTSSGKANISPQSDLHILGVTNDEVRTGPGDLVSSSITSF